MIYKRAANAEVRTSGGYVSLSRSSDFVAQPNDCFLREGLQYHREVNRSKWPRHTIAQAYVHHYCILTLWIDGSETEVRVVRDCGRLLLHALSTRKPA